MDGVHQNGSRWYRWASCSDLWRGIPSGTPPSMTSKCFNRVYRWGLSSWDSILSSLGSKSKGTQIWVLLCLYSHTCVWDLITCTCHPCVQVCTCVTKKGKSKASPACTAKPCLYFITRRHTTPLHRQWPYGSNQSAPLPKITGINDHFV